MDNPVFAVIGGDKRSAMLASLLAEDGYNVFAAGFDSAKDLAQGAVLTDAPTAAAMSDTVILPVMPTTDGTCLNAPLSSGTIALDGGFAEMLEGHRVFSGFCGRLRSVSERYAVLELYDYGREESFLLPNARLTAEAAVMLAIQHFPAALYDSRCLITGYGRIGKALASMLYSLGADVTVCARKQSDLALAASTGCGVTDYPRLSRRFHNYDIIFNTADALVLDRSVLSGSDRGALIIDLASPPWGTDDSAAAEYGVTVMHCPGLPGKYSPLTAAKIIKDTVLAMTGGENT